MAPCHPNVIPVPLTLFCLVRGLFRTPCEMMGVVLIALP